MKINLPILLHADELTCDYLVDFGCDNHRCTVEMDLMTETVVSNAQSHLIPSIWHVLYVAQSCHVCVHRTKTLL